LEIAKETLELKGFRVVAGYVNPIRFPTHPSKAGWFGHLTAWRRRAAIVQLLLQSHAWLRLDCEEGARPETSSELRDVERLMAGTHPIHRLAARLQRRFMHLPSKLNVFWVNGDDVFADKSFYNSKVFAGASRHNIRLSMLINQRDPHSESSWTRAKHSGQLKQLILCEKPAQLQQSSSLIRRKAADGLHHEACELIGNGAAGAYFLYLYYCWQLFINNETVDFEELY